MARAGEFQIPAFPDFESALNELKQFQRSPQPDYQVCVATADGALVVKQTLVDFWTLKHTSFADQMQQLLRVHDNEFNTKKLKRGAAETEDATEEEERPTKRLCPGTSSTMEELETNHPDRTLTCKHQRLLISFKNNAFSSMDTIGENSLFLSSILNQDILERWILCPPPERQRCFLVDWLLYCFYCGSQH